jgi:hypothetical protein
MMPLVPPAAASSVLRALTVGKSFMMSKSHSTAPTSQQDGTFHRQILAKSCKIRSPGVTKKDGEL